LLLRILRDASVDSVEAAAVVAAIEEHVDVAVGQANKALEAKLTGIDSKIETTRSTLTICFGVQTALLALLGAAAIWSNFLK
jgi:CTP synthase (UTP-ammonia lyase)